MKRRHTQARLALGLLVCALAGLAPAQPSDVERARIEALLTTLASDTRHSFVRGGQEYTGPEAARFLRAKWRSMGGHIATAEQFVQELASQSSTTGRPYRVCTAAAACVPAAEHWRNVLKGL